MPIVWIPSLLRELTDGQDSVQIAGTTVREVIDNLDAVYPGIRSRLCDGESLRRGISVAVGTKISTRGLSENVEEGSEVHFVAAIGGGSS